MFERLSATSAGLSSEEAGRRLHAHGPNEIISAEYVSPWSVLIGQFKNVLIVILLIAAAISAFLGQVVESIAITVIVLFAILLGFVQEYRAERAIEALKKMASPHSPCATRRQGGTDTGAGTRPWRSDHITDRRQGAG